MFFFLSIKEIPLFIDSNILHMNSRSRFVCILRMIMCVCFVRLKNTQVHITPWDVETSRHLFGRYEQNVIHTRLHFLTLIFFFFCKLKKKIIENVLNSPQHIQFKLCTINYIMFLIRITLSTTQSVSRKHLTIFVIGSRISLKMVP